MDGLYLEITSPTEPPVNYLARILTENDREVVLGLAVVEGQTRAFGEALGFRYSAHRVVEGATERMIRRVPKADFTRAMVEGRVKPALRK